jgi:hypothetical protein
MFMCVYLVKSPSIGILLRQLCCGSRCQKCRKTEPVRHKATQIGTHVSNCLSTTVFILDLIEIFLLSAITFEVVTKIRKDYVLLAGYITVHAHRAGSCFGSRRPTKSVLQFRISACLSILMKVSWNSRQLDCGYARAFAYTLIHTHVDAKNWPCNSSHAEI